MTDTSQTSALNHPAAVAVDTEPAGGPVQPAGPEKTERARSLRTDAWEELRRRPLFWISGALIVVFVLMAAFPQLFTSTDPTVADLSKAREGPSADAWFGRDGQG